MADPKTRPTNANVEEFLASVPNKQRRADAEVVDALMREVTGESPVLWGTSIVSYGAVESQGSGGQVNPWPIIAFSPRKTEMVLYLHTEVEPRLFEALGPHRRGVSCLYIKRIDDVDPVVLRSLVERSVQLTLG